MIFDVDEYTSPGIDGKDYWLWIAYEPTLDSYFMFIILQIQKSFLNIIEYSAIPAYV